MDLSRPDDVDSVPSALCDGLVRPEDLVANFAAMGDGWDGPVRGGVRLSYALVQPSLDLPGTAQLAELTRAMAEWSRYVAIRWQPAAAAFEPASLSILWGPAEYGDGFPFSAGVLAHAFYPAPPAPEPVAGDIHFNDTFLWGATDPKRWDIFSVALHELGHSLGLVHDRDGLDRLGRPGGVRPHASRDRRSSLREGRGHEPLKRKR